MIEHMKKRPDKSVVKVRRMLLTGLAVMLCVATGMAPADTENAEILREYFVAAGNGLIDGRGTPETPRQTELNNSHAFTWGGYQRPDKAVGVSLNGDAGRLHFDNGNPYTYAYTIFDSTGGNAPDMAIDLGGERAAIEANKAGGSNGWTFRFMIRDAAGNWYIADNEMTGPDGTRILYLGTDGPGGGAVTWTAVDETAGTLDLLAGGDEKELVLGTSGLLPDAAGVTGPDLSAATGGGIYCVSYGGADTKKISHIAWIENLPIGKATDPVPTDGATAAASDRYLSWKSDSEAASHDVYFGPPGDLEAVGNFAGRSVHFSTLASAVSQMPLDAGTYQWRVDSLDDTGAVIAIGDIWTVTIPPYEAVESVIMEDFASYTDSPELLDRWAVSGAGSIGLDDLYGSMAMQYDNTSEGSSVEAGFEPDALAGWTYDGMKVLSISFKGHPGNAPQALYAVLSDGENSVRVTHEDIDAVRSDQWRQWDIALADFVRLGSDPAEAAGLAIGIGGSGTGAGAIFIDDIALYPARCLDEHRSPADVNADCAVDDADIMLIAADWLKSDYRVSAAEPSNGDLVAAYDFDEETGTTALDSSDNAFNATIDPNQVTDYRSDQGRGGGRCLKISRDLQLLLPQDVFAPISDEMTVSVWTRSNPGGAASLQQAQYSGGPVPAANALFEWDFVSWDVAANAVQDEVWNHWAAVKNAAGRSMKIYHNGVLVARNRDATAALAGIQAGQTTIELDSAGGAVYIDELKIYRRALLHGQIVYLASVPGGAIVQPVNPLLTGADINTDGRIDLTDLAICARDWLAIRFWPD